MSPLDVAVSSSDPPHVPFLDFEALAEVGSDSERGSDVSRVVLSLQSALVFWLKEGVDGVQLSGVERVADVVPSLWADIRAIVQDRAADQSKRLEVTPPNRDRDPKN